jgi:hypothetical protein
LQQVRNVDGRKPLVACVSVLPKPGESIGVMPFGPFVTLLPKRLSPFRATT